MSPFRPRNNRRAMAMTLAMVSLAAAACAKPDAAGVSVKTIPSDIVFNAKAPEPEAIPSLALPPATDGSFSDVGNSRFGGQTEEGEIEQPKPKPRTPVTAPPLPAKAECPAALATAFPREAATFDVARVPAAGDYRWKRTISTPIGSTGKTSEQVVFNRHQISNVSKITETPNAQTPDKPTRTFTYDEAAFFVDGSKLTSYQVKDNAPQQSVGVQTGQRASTGVPDRGVALTKVVDRNAEGKPVGLAFSPSTPVLILPLPVAVPTEFESVGVDPTTGSSLSIRGTVVGKERVDACGDVVDGWKVTSNQTFTTGDNRRFVSEVEYFVATQLGGIIIFQKALPSAAVRAATDPTVIDNLAQLDPTPPS